MKRKKKMKRLVSLALSVCLMLGAAPLVKHSIAAAWSLAEKEDYSEDVTTLTNNQSSVDKLLENGKGILYGEVPYIWNYSTNKTDACPSITKATDGSADGEFYPYTGLYSCVTFQLSDIYDITEFGLILSNSGLRNSYEVYVGTSYDTLYSGTPVYVFDGTAEGYTSSMGQYIQFTADETHALPRGSIIGLKFTECMNSSGVIAEKNRAVRVDEIFANGTATNQDVAGIGLDLEKYDPYYYSYTSICDKNILKNASVYAYSGMDVHNAAKISGYFDDDPRSESYISNSSDNPSITFALRAETVISSFRMYQSNANYRATYRVYVGNDADTLYSEENLLYSWDGAANTSRVQEHYFNASGKQGRFMGIYFDDTTNDETVTSGIRIAEIFADGKELDTETYNSPCATVEARVSADNNLLKGKTAAVNLSLYSESKKYCFTSNSNIAYLNDGTVTATKHCDLYGYGKDYILILYNLGGIATVEGFEFFNRAAAQNTSYEVYVSDQPNDILNSDNLVYSYDGSEDIAESYRTQYVHFAVPKVGAFLAVKLTDTYGANTDSRNFRVAEIAAYGTVTEPVGYDIYNTKGLNAYTEGNLLQGLTAEVTGVTGGDEGWNAALTDANVSSKKDITGVSVGSASFTYDIGYTAVIDKFIIGQYMNYTTGFQYYVSHDKDTLYNAENLVAEYNMNDLYSVSSENYEESVVFSEDSKPVGRYVGVRVANISNNETRMRIYEISAIGGKAPMELTPHNYDGFKTGFEEGDSATGIGGVAYTATDDADANVYAGAVSRLFAAGSEATDWVVEDYLLEAGRTYDISFWYKSESDATLGTVNGNTFGSSNGEWKEYTETVTTEEEGNLKIKLNAASTDLYIDDISIVPVITVINDGVTGGTGAVEISENSEGTKLATFTATREFGYSLSAWVDMAGNVISTDEVYVATNPWPGYTLKPVFVKQQLAFDLEDENIITSENAVWYAPEAEGYTAKYVYSGNKSIKYSVASTGETITLPVDLVANETYTISFKYLNMNENATINAAIGLNGTAAETVALTCSDEWQTCSAEVTTSADSDEATITISGDTAVIYIDDICVIPAADQLTLSVAVGSSENGIGTADYSRIVPEMPVKFTATANSGYIFDKWINAKGETVSRNSSFVMLNITEDTTLTPIFVAVSEATRTYGFETAANGTIEGIAELCTPETPYYDSKYVHWGESSIRMDGYGSSYTYPYTLKAGQKYKVAFWYFLPETTSANITFTLGSTTNAGCTSTGLWYERFCKITPTEDMQLTIDVQGGAGPVYIDDIIIEPYHTVSVDESINYYVSVSTVEPIHGDTITATAKRAIGENELFYGWIKDGEVTPADSYDVELTVTEDLVITEELIGKPVYKNRYDTNGDGKQNIADLVFAVRRSESDYALGCDIDRSGDINSDDIAALKKKLLGYETESQRDAYLNQEKKTIVGSSDDLTTWIYQLEDSNIQIREAVFDSSKGGEPAEIIQLTDVHFNALNEQDYIDNNPTVISSYDKHTAGQNGTHLERAIRCMEYANQYFDQTVITGDNMSYQTWGGIEQIKEYLWGADPSAMITLGNHDMMQRMSGLYPETTQLDSRYSTLQENWRHDVYYASRVVKDKVMVIQMDNSLSYYWEGQAEKLAADIEKARENGYIILIFQHVPIMTNNPEYSQLEPLINPDNSVYDFSTNDGFDGIRTNKNATTTEVYNLITQNADVIKGLFCGHYHDDLYCEVKATEPDGTETVIPQYVLQSTAYDSGIGHALKITVK